MAKTLSSTELAEVQRLRQVRDDASARIDALLGYEDKVMRPIHGPCTRCGYTWRGTGRAGDPPPAVCARCGSAYWQRQPKTERTRRPGDAPSASWSRRRNHHRKQGAGVQAQPDATHDKIVSMPGVPLPPSLPPPPIFLSGFTVSPQIITAATEDEASVAQRQSADADVTHAGGPTATEDAGSIPAEASPTLMERADKIMEDAAKEEVTNMINKRMESLPPAREHVLDNGNLLIEGMEMQRATRVMPPGWQAQQAAERAQQAGAENVDVESLPPIQRD